MTITRNTPFEQLPTLLKIEELMEILDISRSTVYKLIESQPINDYVIKMGKVIRVNKDFMKPANPVSIENIQQL